eukprot:12525353-Alexandrium_andersonii.AAC.1
MEEVMQRQLSGDFSIRKRSRTQCLAGLVTAWCTPEIVDTCARGRYRNHLSNALDGSEDSLGG